MNVVVVESPAKAKTINKYLGRDYKVLASYGHVRDLPAKDGSVRPDEDFAMSWQMDDRAKKHIDAIVKALKDADHLYLATDPDREGEAISWHVEELLRQRKALGGVDVKRIVFHEITKSAVLEAVAHPRELNRELIEAYLARRALDYLVGFTLSPVLWRKLPGARSAGRVQSVALRLISEREAEIEAFRPREYWTVDADFETAAGGRFVARLTHLEGRKLKKFDIGDEAAAGRAVELLSAGRYAVAKVERKQTRRNPQPPFTTSTLQQEASRKLGFGATQTMRTAQRLYEGVDIGGETVGLITYMRTDSVNLSGEAIGGCRSLIASQFGNTYLPEKPRGYRNTARNAQEAHEAIRPTNLYYSPRDVASYLNDAESRLYELIWKRTLASQMESARLDQVAIDIAAEDGRAVLRATGSVVVFDGFLRLYQEGRDDPTDEDSPEGRVLPSVNEGEALDRGAVKPEQHFTQPPPRFSEASLVKRLEELGIGRPSTYASILQVLQDREYVRLEKRRFIPEDRGRLVATFLGNFFDRYLQNNFTPDLEQRLDDVSNCRIDWRAVLRDFWAGFSEKVDDTKDLTITQVIDALDEELGPHFFPPQEDGKDPRACPACADGRIGLKLGRHGAFIGCSNYPDCKYTRRLTVPGNGDAADEFQGPRELGSDPETGLTVSLRKGPYGVYVQLGDAEDGGKPKRSSLPRGMPPDEVNLETALGLLALPREVGPHPETGQMITAGIGRYGPYVRCDGQYKSLGPDENVLTVGINRAVALLAEAGKGHGRVAAVLRTIGNHPEDDAPITVHKGRYGPYIKHKRLMASVPKDRDPEEVSLEQAVELLAARAARAKSKGKGKAATKSKAKTKAKTKKSTTKRTRKKPAAKACATVTATGDAGSDT